MTEEKRDAFLASIKNQDESIRLTERLFEVTAPDAVFSKPRKSGEYTIITASEVAVSLGSGYGFGGSNLFEGADDNEGEFNAGGGGGGGGGGGVASARPVAVISVGPEGVQVQPVLDRTKFGIALVTAVGSMFLALSRMKKG
ncbi:MAG TPA: hypothetical protein VJ965_10975 [Anaerolineales bacterium]|nr:hypothetical protein [Anaerolineales bacterium]